MDSKRDLIAYVDGSYDDSIKTYAFGCVFRLPDGSTHVACGNGNNPESVKQRNVSGEMLGAMYAVQCARKSGYSSIDIYYDYMGIACWVNGQWKAKNELTQKYRDAMRSWGTTIEIRFHKVESHTGVELNELADKMAKKGLTGGKGIPQIMMVEDLEVL